MSARKKTATRFGPKHPQKVPVKVDDLEGPSKARAVKGGAVRLARVDNDAHGCPACPHPSASVALGGPDTTTR